MIKEFSSHLFWDVNRNKLDLMKDKSFIVKQVLEYGFLNDWILLKRFYGVEQIALIAKSFRELEPKALSFISVISNYPKTEFRCFAQKQLMPQHWNF